MSGRAVKILGHERIYKGFFQLDRYRLRHLLYGGGWSAEIKREIFSRGSSAGVLLYDPARDKVVLVEQFRLAAQLAGFPPWQIEVVAGIVDEAGESAAQVARREAGEEAGLAIIGTPKLIHRFMPSSGGCTEIVDLFYARVDARSAGGIHGLAAEHEDIKVMVLSYRAAMSRLRAGKIQNGATLLALHWLAANRARLRREKKPARPRRRAPDRGR